MIEIVSYRPDWPEAYAQLANSIRECIGQKILGIHHIGSTAVPGLAAKDVIDVQITLADLSSDIAAELENAGFELISQPVDHCPPGKKLGAEQLEKRFYKSLTRPANIHVRQIGRFNQRYPLLCRDYLRAHKNAADAYAQIKRELAARFPDDTASYYAVKDPTFDLIMAAAEDWASTIHWMPPPSD